ncbi:MAG TPA: hypothetical protein VKY36_02890 [Moheibacter sp.]|nr:hypothetical protein [Moheibacter sp.]
MKIFIFISLFFLAFTCQSSVSKDGFYIYDVAFSEWQGKSIGGKVEVEIKNNKIVVRNYEGLSGKKGEIIDSGILIRHISGNWIIADSENDKYASEIGGCSGGPAIIDLDNKKFWLC